MGINTYRKLINPKFYNDDIANQVEDLFMVKKYKGKSIIDVIGDEDNFIKLTPSVVFQIKNSIWENKCYVSEGKKCNLIHYIGDTKQSKELFELIMNKTYSLDLVYLKYRSLLYKLLIELHNTYDISCIKYSKVSYYDWSNTYRTVYGINQISENLQNIGINILSDIVFIGKTSIIKLNDENRKRIKLDKYYCLDDYRIYSESSYLFKPIKFYDDNVPINDADMLINIIDSELVTSNKYNNFLI